METLGLNVTDLVILFVIGSSGIISLFRGFTKEFLSLLLWIFAFFAAVGFEGYVTPKIIEIVGNPEASKIIASVLIFLVSIVIGGFLTNLISRIVKWSGMSGFDKFMGVLFGVSRGLIVILVVYFLLPSNLKEAEIFTESKYFSSGKNVTVVPVFRMPTLPVTLSSEAFSPPLNFIE